VINVLHYLSSVELDMNVLFKVARIESTWGKFVPSLARNKCGYMLEPVNVL
jgi:hypothetical protein